MNALLMQDQYERSLLNIYRMIFATMGTIFITTFTSPGVNFFGNDARAWGYTFIVFWILAFGEAGAQSASAILAIKTLYIDLPSILTSL